ncbi:phage tail protein [Hymenobacter defluvii]|uniref:Phage tail protein n=1 Tax=Hymenobacter defluvii TaxID=2054411 RepID=A0ABS3TI40_9BACT|nr:tail fiber protein [Hymenobacter defluvii]MBO3273335.1 phage tail protein [Hymenobacter defluvii]
MDEAFLGQIILVGFDFAPQGWALCNGQLMQIRQYSALFALLGTRYGGDGVNTFGLPNLNGRVAIGQGASTTGTTYPIGQAAGTEKVTLTVANMPMHTHALGVNKTAGTTDSPVNGVPAIGQFTDSGSGGPVNVNGYAASADAVANPQAISSVGGNQPFAVQPPYVVLNYLICLQGIYPSRQ